MVIIKDLESLPSSRAFRIAKADMELQLARLARETDTVKARKGFKEYLTGIAHLWRYSLFNQWMIRMSMPNATSVMGARQWEALGRKVKEGEKPIIVFAPRFPNSGWPLLAVKVYDISQTEGPSYKNVNLGLKPGKCPQLGTIIKAAPLLGIKITGFSKASPEIMLRVISRNAAGMASDKSVYYDDKMSELEQATVIVHEYAHVVLAHAKPPKDLEWLLNHKAFEETEADATRYVVLTALNLPVESAGYIAWHFGTGSMILGAVKRIQTAASAILFAIVDKKKPKYRMPAPRKKKT